MLALLCWPRPGLYADRLSINVELPEEVSLKRLAPEKRRAGHPPYDAGAIHERLLEAKAEKKGKPESATFRPGGAEHPDDRRRGYDQRPHHS